jgi:hypothetical protein
MDSWKHCPRCHVETELGWGITSAPNCAVFENKSDLQGCLNKK